MDITITTREAQVTVVKISGELDGKTAPQAQEHIAPLCQPEHKLIIDMSEVTYMSSAGLRLMLLFHRQISSVQGQMVLVGLSDELKDTMSATGFLTYLTTADSLDAGVAVVQ